LTSAFLNAGTGQLYGWFSEGDIRERPSVSEMEPDDMALLKRVVETAKEYFEAPSRFPEAQISVKDDEDEQ
jgi:hypothetical protein